MWKLNGREWKLVNVEGYVKRAFNSLKPSGFVHIARFIIQKLDVTREKFNALVRLCDRKCYYSSLGEGGRAG
jgi:uncharacterized OsmC-like protein